MFGHKKPEGIPDASPVGNTVSLTKGSRIQLTKTPLITVTTSWTDKSKDYDVMALVKYKDGHVETVCAVNNEHPQTIDGAIKHLGDIGSGSSSVPTEVIEIRLNDQVAEIAPFAYSAIENGPGSFREYGVSVAIDNGSEQAIAIKAEESSPERHRYTLAFGRIINGDKVTIENLELYSKNNSEKRPAYVGDTLTMDAGVENHTK